MKYTLITLIALLSTCNLSSLPQDKGGKPISSKWMDWTMPSPPVVDSSTDKIDTVAITNHFYFITHNTNLVDTALQQLTSQCEQSFQTIKQFIGDQKNRAKIDYRIYPSIEQKALRTSKIDIAHLEKKSSTIHIVWNQYFQGNQLQQENKILLRQLLDRPLIAALEEGLSNHFTQNWYQEGYAYWGGVLYSSNNLPPLVELLDNEVFEKESDLVMGAMSGVFVDFLMKQLGKSTFIESYSTADKEELLLLEEVWQQYLEEQYKNFDKSNRRTQSKPSTSYLKGFNFAHEGYRIYNGYGSQLAKQSLERLQQIGTNAIAVVPYSFMRNPKQPTPLLIDHRAGGENDESVLFAHYEAKAMGMHTMLKPQIWLRRSWPGDIDMANKADWNQFFDYYYRWMRHYALLAEMSGFDSLCLGVEFVKATLLKEQEWRQLIKQIRGIYSGPLTYAANWGDEFEQLQFWDALDFIGINCYYPLSKEKQPSKRTLKKSFEAIAQKIEKVARRFNKPIVFTEIGFRSVEKTWANPHEDANGRAFKEQSQALAYEVVFETIQNKDWCQGILWWKWPSYLTYGGERNTGFAPTGKAAERVVEEWFTK